MPDSASSLRGTSVRGVRSSRFAIAFTPIKPPRSDHSSLVISRGLEYPSAADATRYEQHGYANGNPYPAPTENLHERVLLRSTGNATRTGSRPEYRERDSLGILPSQTPQLLNAGFSLGGDNRLRYSRRRYSYWNTAGLATPNLL